MAPPVPVHSSHVGIRSQGLLQEHVARGDEQDGDLSRRRQDGVGDRVRHQRLAAEDEHVALAFAQLGDHEQIDGRTSPLAVLGRNLGQGRGVQRTQ